MTRAADHDTPMRTNDDRPALAADDARLDEALRELHSPCVPPALCASLEKELETLRPVRVMAPYMVFALIGLTGLLYGTAMLLFMDLRPDLADLPTAWLVIYSSAWLASFAAVAYLASVPVRGQVSPNWRYAGLAAMTASVGFVIGGLLFHESAPGVSVVGEASMDDLLGHGVGCIGVGLLSALVPVLLGALLLRGRLPVGSHWAGAGLGAAGGSLGGLILQLHCHVADGLHLGVVHGGVVAIGAVIGALLLPRSTG